MNEFSAGRSAKVNAKAIKNCYESVLSYGTPGWTLTGWNLTPFYVFSNIMLQRDSNFLLFTGIPLNACLQTKEMT